jgi:hypothetical protein
MKFDLGRKRRGRRGDSSGATISHKGSYVRHLNFDAHATSDCRGIVKPFTNEIEQFVQGLYLKDITIETGPKLASEWVSMKQRAGVTPSLLQKDTRGLSGINAEILKKGLLKMVSEITKRRSIQAKAISAEAYWYISGGPAETDPTAQSMAPGQDFVCYGLVADVTWRIETGGEIFEFRRQYGGYIPYVLDLTAHRGRIQIPREMSLMDDGSSGLTVGAEYYATASLEHSQPSHNEQFGAPQRARRFGRRASGLEDASSSISNASRISRFKDIIREFKPVRFATDKLSSYFEPSVLEQEPSRSADSLDRNSSDRELSQASLRTSREGNQRRWMRPIGCALNGVTKTMAARRGALVDDRISHRTSEWGWARRPEGHRSDRSKVRTANDGDLDETSIHDRASTDRMSHDPDRVDTISVMGLSAVNRRISHSRQEAIEASNNRLVGVLRKTGLHLRALPREDIEGNDQEFGDWTRELTKLRQKREQITQELQRLGVERGEIQQAELRALGPARMSSEHHEPSTPQSSISTDAPSIFSTLTPCTTLSTSSMGSIGCNSSGARH